MFGHNPLRIHLALRVDGWLMGGNRSTRTAQLAVMKSWKFILCSNKTKMWWKVRTDLWNFSLWTKELAENDFAKKPWATINRWSLRHVCGPLNCRPRSSWNTLVATNWLLHLQTKRNYGIHSQRECATKQLKCEIFHLKAHTFVRFATICSMYKVISVLPWYFCMAEPFQVCHSNTHPSAECRHVRMRGCENARTRGGGRWLFDSGGWSSHEGHRNGNPAHCHFPTRVGFEHLRTSRPSRPSRPVYLSTCRPNVDTGSIRDGCSSTEPSNCHFPNKRVGFHSKLAEK